MKKRLQGFDMSISNGGAPHARSVAIVAGVFEALSQFLVSIWQPARTAAATGRAMTVNAMMEDPT
jgi:hypothetical protein